MTSHLTTPPKIRRLRAASIVSKLFEKNPASVHVADTAKNLYELSQNGQKPAQLNFALRYVPDSRSPKEIKESFETFVQAILKLLRDLFCTSGRCEAEEIYIDPIRRIESCTFRFEPFSQSSPT